MATFGPQLYRPFWKNRYGGGAREFLPEQRRTATWYLDLLCAISGAPLLLRANVRRCRNSSGERAWAAAAAAAGNARYCEDWLNHSYTALKPCSHAFLARLRKPSDASPMRPAPSPSIGRRAFRRGLKKRIANASAFRELPDAKWTRTQAPANFSPLPANTRAGNCRCHRSRREKTTRTS